MAVIKVSKQLGTHCKPAFVSGCNQKHLCFPQSKQRGFILFYKYMYNTYINTRAFNVFLGELCEEIKGYVNKA